MFHKISLLNDADLVRRAKAGDKIALNELIRLHKDLIDVKVNNFKKAPVPGAAIEGEALALFLAALDRYTPASGANFRTYLEHMLRGLNRYVNSNKNIARIPENKFLRMRHYMSLRSLLVAQYNREPTLDELSDETGWSKTDVAAMEQALKQKDLAAFDFEEQGKAKQMESRLYETSEFLYASLTPQEKQIYDYSLGAHGKPVINSVAELAKKTGMSTDQVYKIRRQIAQRISQHL